MKNSRIYLCLIFLVFLGCTTSKRIIYMKKPTDVANTGLDIDDFIEKYEDYDGVYLSINETIEHSGTKQGAGEPWKYVRIRQIKYMVLNPDNERLTTLKLSASEAADFESIYSRVTYPDGTIKEYDSSNYIMEENSGSRIYKFIYPNIVKGTIIEEGNSVSYNAWAPRPPLEHDIPLQFNIPCLSVKFKYAYPDWWHINYKKIAKYRNYPFGIEKDEKNHKRIITVSAQNVGAIKNELYTPAFKELANYFQFMITSLQMNGTSYYAPSSWSKVASTFEKYAMKKGGGVAGFFSDPTKEAKTMTENLIVGCKNNIERAYKIVEAVQKSFEIIDDLEVNDLKKVFENKKGNIYKITGITQLLLDYAGINSKFCLVHSAKDGYFDETYIQYSQMNIPAVMAEIDGEHHFFFPYIKYLSPGHIPEHLLSETAIMFADKKSKRSTAANRFIRPTKMIKLPDETQSNNKVVEHYDLTIAEDGLIKVKEKKILTGYMSYYIRKELDDLKKDEYDKVIRSFLTYDEGNVELISHKVSNLDSSTKELILELEYTIDNLVTVTPEEVIFQTGGLFSPISLKKYKVSSKDRENPIRVYYDESYEKQISIKFPFYWSLSETPEQVELKNDFGAITANFELSDTSKLKVSQSRFLKRCSEPKERFSEMLEIIGNSSKLSVPTLFFTVNPSN